MKNSRIRWYRCIRCILKHIIITNLHNISENMPTFVHQTLQVIGYDRFFYASIFNFAKHRHGTKRWKCMRNHAELVCGAKMKTADHKVTAPLIPRSGRQRPWLLAYPPTTGEPIFGEHEVNVPAIPRSSPRGGVRGFQMTGALVSDMHACNVCYTLEVINFPFIMTWKLNLHIKLKYNQ